MADKNSKAPGNVPGKWYVDTNCILCNLCEQTAEKNFAAGEEYDYVCQQPESEEEVELCKQAMEECPVEAIGDDGDS
ncbi:ferredoxin [Candidatus Sumerlaeota bacterium]|nr:ferredoxin [Candidatus Sumerlaeota bacterium]